MNIIDNREVAKVAREAAVIIQERGKATGDLQDSRGRVCAIGAIRAAEEQVVPCLCPHDRHPRNVGTRVIYLATQKLPSNYRVRGLPDWNDRSATTAEDIAKLFMQVADEVEVSE